MRSRIGGWLANSASNKPLRSAISMWPISSLSALLSVARSGDAAIFLSAPAMPCGLRVNCTAEASARNSRFRETADLIRRVNNTPM